jgi:hypothetical protein
MGLAQCEAWGALGVLQGSPPDGALVGLDLPQAQQVGQVTWLLSRHRSSPSIRPPGDDPSASPFGLARDELRAGSPGYGTAPRRVLVDQPAERPRAEILAVM